MGTLNPHLFKLDYCHNLNRFNKDCMAARAIDDSFPELNIT